MRSAHDVTERPKGLRILEMAAGIMSTDPLPQRSLPIDAILVLALACFLYIAMLSSVSRPAGGGESAIGAAIQSFLLLVFLWIALAILLLIGGLRGDMPRWAAILTLILHPLSGIAAFVAIDMYSRHVYSHHVAWPLIVPASLPPLIALYAMWARLPALHAALPARATSVVIWGVILILTIAPFPAAYWGP
ncbi:hypothetical protein SAMN05444161_3531 [Rhizobiales bacterium GAS191]|nr:hypothetical protein SAMN05444161_3531 [Rhizobiales bacterium GAS191]